MCGRFALSVKTKDIEKLLPKIKINSEILPKYNISPTNIIDTVLNTEPNIISSVKWGLIPSWSKDSSIASKMINARSDSVTQKPSYKNLIKKKRCIILASGFYEWKADITQKTKQPYYIKFKTDSIIPFAGLWDEWKNNDGNFIKTATIITTDANELISEIHHRMPVIINENLIDLWLSNNELDNTTLNNIFAPYSSDLMELYPVSFLVNNPLNNSIKCIEPVN